MDSIKTWNIEREICAENSTINNKMQGKING